MERVLIVLLLVACLLPRGALSMPVMVSYLPGDHVPSRFNAGIVAASYVASFCGCLCTIEILHRRGTALHNWRSWAETLSCAIMMGVVGIWCMHFIGNRAVVLGNGDPMIQLVYKGGFTGLSLVLPVIGLTVAFSVAELPVRSRLWRKFFLVVTGTLAGLAIVGMHYVANLGVPNYDMNYNPILLALSFIIAVGSCLTALVLFYSLREKWISAWWKRALCAMVLAAGVSAMHFTAATDCDYVLKQYTTDDQVHSSDVQVATAGALCGATVVAVAILLFASRWRRSLDKSRSHKVMLAAAIFDPVGRILVKPEGTLPAREITDKHGHRTFDDEFDTSNKVFQFCFRVSHNWSAVSGFVRDMKSHLNASRDTAAEDSHPSSSQSSAEFDSETYIDSETIFKEQFCTAAASMASSMSVSLEKLGVLYDKIIETGTLRVEGPACKNSNALNRTPSQMESASRMDFCGRGQLMFVTKEVSEEEASRLLNSGFKFASVQHVGRNIAQSMQISLPVLESHISGLKRYNENLRSADKPGTWLAFFALIPRPRGFDVAVKKDNRNELPDVQVLSTHPQEWQTTFFNKLDGLRVDEILPLLDDRSGKLGSLLAHDFQFVARLRQAIVTLTQQFPREWVDKARFSSNQLIAHYSHPLSPGSSITTLYAFTVISNVHTSISRSQALVQTPNTFLNARHRVYAGSPDHAILAQDIHQTFAPLFATRRPKHHHSRLPKLSIAISSTNLHRVKKTPSGCSGGKTISRSSTTDHVDEHSSVHELVDVPVRSSSSSDGETARGRSNDFGGILVNSQTVIKTDSKLDSYEQSRELVIPLGINTAVGAAKPEKIFVDELVAVTKDRFKPSSMSTFR